MKPNTLYVFVSGVLILVVIGGVMYNSLNDNNRPHAAQSKRPNRVYTNPWPTFEKRGFGDFLKWVFLDLPFKERGGDGSPTISETVPNDGALLKVRKEDFTVTWVGHSTVLIQLDGVAILTDPVWSDRASPVSWAGPKRHTPPGIALENLPGISLVLISHNHYDHLDIPTIRRLGNTPLYVVPLGVGSTLMKAGVTNFRECAWWDTLSFNGIECICTPAQHFSGRGFFDRNETLWCNWALRGRSGSVYFAGDTGYFSLFVDIGRLYGPFDLACLPIGAYEPQWFMKSVHMNPQEAIRAFEELRGGTFLAIHWGTFTLALDPPGLAPMEFNKEIKQRGLDPGRFLLLKPGETRIVNSPLAVIE